MMRNQPHYDFADAERNGTPIVPMSRFRIRILTTTAFLTFFVVVCRIVVLQQKQETFADSRDVTLEIRTPIPVRDGRVLTSDGLVVAYDRERFDLAVHYRWLEKPVNAEWLRIMTRRELPRSERTSNESLEQQKTAIISRREQLWNDLSGYLGISADEFEKRRAAVQQRVERIIQSVNGRRKKEVVANGHSITKKPFRSLQSLMDFVVEELTTPPRRTVNEEIVVQEELDYHTMFRGIPRDLALHIESHPGLFPGTQINIEHNRLYEHGTFLSSIVGLRKPFVHKNGQAFSAARMDVIPNVRSKGESGIEQAFDRMLRGVSGQKLVKKLRSGETVQTETTRPPNPGHDVVLTINSGIQRQLESLLDERVTPVIPAEFSANGDSSTNRTISGGCILVADIRSGEIVASATAPRPNLTLLADGDPEYWELIRNDSRGPLMPRMTHLELPPGSIFKIVSTVAMLENDPSWSQRVLPCQGYLDSPNRHRCYIFRHYGVGHGNVDIQRAIRESCNVFFFQAARELGPEELIRTAARLGFGHPTGIGFPGEKSGNVPAPQKGKWFPGDTLGLAIGQSSLLVTPLQIVQLMAMVANDGYAVPLHVVRPSRGPMEHSAYANTIIPVHFESTQHHLRRSVIPEETARLIQQAMKSVVEHPRGTGHKSVYHDAVTIAGKTGTAEVGGNKGDHAWFAGFTPADDPKYAFVVVLEHAGSGGREAGPLAKNVVTTLLDAEFLQSNRVKTD